jgi:hypothetical protein
MASNSNSNITIIISIIMGRVGGGLVGLEEEVEEEWWCFRGHVARKKLLGRNFLFHPP